MQQFNVNYTRIKAMNEQYMAVVQLRADRRFAMHASQARPFWRRWVWLATLPLWMKPI